MVLRRHILPNRALHPSIRTAARAFHLQSTCTSINAGGRRRYTCAHAPGKVSVCCVAKGGASCWRLTQKVLHSLIVHLDARHGHTGTLRDVTPALGNNPAHVHPHLATVPRGRPCRQALKQEAERTRDDAGII